MKRTPIAFALLPLALHAQSLQAQVRSTESTAASGSTREHAAPAPGDAPSEQADAPPAPGAEAPEDNRALFQRAEQAYDRGEYDNALELFELLYARTEHPALLFNMAQAHRMAGPDHCAESYRLYVQYLVDDPEPPNGREVRERVKELEPCAKKAAEQEQESAQPEEPPSPTDSSPSEAQVVTIASGAVLLAGLGLFSAAKIRFALAKDECPCEEDSFAGWQTVEKVGIGTMIAGGTGLAVGGAWWWASIDPTPGEEAVWLTASGTF